MIRTDHNDVLNVLLDRGLGVDTVTERGWTPLMFAAREGHLKCLATLIERGADCSLGDVDGDTALMLAARAGKVGAVTALAQGGGDPSHQNRRGQSALMHAASKEMVAALLQLGAEVNTRDQHGSSPLTVAAEFGHEEAVLELLNRGADVSVIDNDGENALMMAATKGKVNIVKALLEKGARPQRVNNKGENALEKAAKSGHVEVTKILGDHSDREWRNKCLISASKQKKVDIVASYISVGADINARDTNDMTGLHYAAKEGNTKVLLLYLDYGLDVNITGGAPEAWSPLMFAARDGQLTAVKILLERGAKIDFQNKSGKTALFIAARNCRSEVVLELLEQGADPYIEDTAKKNALTVTAEKFSKLLSEMEEKVEKNGSKTKKFAHFIEKVIQTNAQSGNENALVELLMGEAKMDEDKAQNTACKIITYKLIELILSTDKIHSNDYDIIGRALHTAAHNGNIKMLERLLRRGANMDLQNQFGESALQIAAKTGHDDIVRLLLSHDIPDHVELSIQARVDNIRRYVESKHFKPELFDKEQMFFMKENKNKETILESIVKEELVKEREVVLDIMKKVDQANNREFKNSYYYYYYYYVQQAESMYRVTSAVKKAMPSSVGRKQCIQSVQDRYSWGRAKMVLMIVLSFVTHVIMGTGFYASDIVTDVNFSLYMLQGYHRATMATSSSSVVLDKCKQEFYVMLDNTFAGCKENYLECLTYLQNATRQVEDCYATEERFDDPMDWWLAGVVSFVHCGLPVFFGLLFWIILELEDNSSGDNWNIFRIPLPFITKMYKFHCDKNYYTLKAQNQDKKDYEKSLKKCQIKIEKHANAVNFSMITEAALESSFQFFFQSVYYIPTLGITKCFNYIF